mgnify:CR=1 FL=1
MRREVGSLLGLPLGHIMLTSLVAECYPLDRSRLPTDNDSIQKVHTTDEFICYPELRSFVDEGPSGLETFAVCAPADVVRPALSRVLVCRTGAGAIVRVFQKAPGKRGKRPRFPH